MGAATTAAVIEACSSDPRLRAAMEQVRATQRPGSPEFIRLVRGAVEAACADCAESLPAPIRMLFSDVLACVVWVRVAEHVARRATPPFPKAPPPDDGTDPFSL